MALRRNAAKALRYYALGFEEIGWLKLAQRARTRSLEVDPVHDRHWQARMLRKVGRRRDALSVLERLEAALPALTPSSSHHDMNDLARHSEALGVSFGQFAKATKALALIRRATELSPDVAQYWVSYADALNRAGEFDQALEAQRTAYVMSNGGGRDVLARMLAKQGQEASAFDLWPESVPTGAINADRHQGGPTLVRGDAPNPAVQTADIVIDLTDFIGILEHHRLVSGIQRVQAEFALRMFTGAGAEHRHAALYDDGAGRWRLIDRSAVVELIHWARRPVMLGATRTRRRVRPVRESSGGDFYGLRRPILFVPGATWSRWRFMLSVREAQRAIGLRYVPFVHDCVPLLLPETCSPDMPAMYSRWLASAFACADAFVVNSANTARDLGAVRAQAGAPERPVAVAKLNGRTQFAAEPLRPMMPPAIAERADRNGFAIYVSSIEPRKNHRDVLEAWGALFEEHGDATPALLLIGRAGWREEAALALIDDSDTLNGVVAHLPEVSDAELAWCYREARFSLYVSQYEGWGMPVTESLDAGTPAIVTRVSSLIEAGENGAEFVELGDKAGLLSAIERLSFDAAARAKAAERARSAPLRDWSDVADDVLRLLEGGIDPSIPPGAPALPPGVRIDFGERRFGRDLMVQEGALLGAAWMGRDPGALWAFGGAPVGLAFRAPGPGVLSVAVIAPLQQVTVTAFAPNDPTPRATLTLAPGERARLELEIVAEDLDSAGGFAVMLRSTALLSMRGFGVSGVRFDPVATAEA